MTLTVNDNQHCLLRPSNSCDFC